MTEEKRDIVQPSGVPNTTFSVLDLQAGARVQLVNEAIAEIVDNPRDGMWLMVRYIDLQDDPDREGVEELVFAEDIVAVIEK